MAARTVTVAAPAVEGVDPDTFKQVATLSLKLFGAIASKQWGVALTVGVQLAGLIADAIDTTPAPAPVGGPDGLPEE